MNKPFSVSIPPPVINTDRGKRQTLGAAKSSWDRSLGGGEYYCVFRQFIQSTLIRNTIFWIITERRRPDLR
jgi:hypothetical protein